MRHVNRVELIGTLFDDPQVRTLPGGNRFASFKLVTNKNSRNRETGGWNTKSEFHRVTIWNEDAIKEIEGGVRKGATVQVIGEVQTRKWQAQDGSDRYSTHVKVDRFGEFKFMEAPKERDSSTMHRDAPDKALDDDGDVPF